MCCYDPSHKIRRKRSHKMMANWQPVVVIKQKWRSFTIYSLHGTTNDMLSCNIIYMSGCSSWRKNPIWITNKISLWSQLEFKMMANWQPKKCGYFHRTKAQIIISTCFMQRCNMILLNGLLYRQETCVKYYKVSL